MIITHKFEKTIICIRFFSCVSSKDPWISYLSDSSVICRLWAFAKEISSFFFFLCFDFFLIHAEKGRVFLNQETNVRRAISSYNIWRGESEFNIFRNAPEP